jgi:hypothetical protein
MPARAQGAEGEPGPSRVRGCCQVDVGGRGGYAVGGDGHGAAGAPRRGLAEDDAGGGGVAGPAGATLAQIGKIGACSGYRVDDALDQRPAPIGLVLEGDRGFTLRGELLAHPS